MDATMARDICEDTTNTQELAMKAKFEEELISTLKPKQNVIECRCIFNDQIQKLISIISITDSTKRNQQYYYYSERYYVIDPVDGGFHLLAAKKSKKAVDDGVDRIIVGLESMWKET